MRIIHVISSLAPRYGGPPKVCLEMARAVAELGHEVSVYTTDIDGTGQLPVDTNRAFRKDGVTVRYFPVSFPRFWRFSPGLALALRRDMARFDVAHIHSIYLFPSIAAAHYCQKFGVPYLIRPHGNLEPFIFRRHRFRKYPFEVLFERRNLREAGAIHFTADEEYRLSRPRMFGGRGVVVPNGVNSADYANLPGPGGFRSRYPEMNGRRIVLFLGRISYKKGLDILLEAFAFAAGRTPHLHLAVVGPDDEGLAGGLKAAAERAGIGGRVTFTGMLLGREKLAAFRDAELFVLPSHSENFGVAVVEAMASRVPVLISDRVNIWREIDKAGAGAVVKLDAGVLGRTMSALLSRPASLKRMGERGAKLVRRVYDWSIVSRRLAAVYRKLAEGKLVGGA